MVQFGRARRSPLNSLGCLAHGDSMAHGGRTASGALCLLSRLIQESLDPRDLYCLMPTRHPEVVEDGHRLVAHGRLAVANAEGDLRVAETLTHEEEHGLLSRGELTTICVN